MPSRRLRRWLDVDASPALSGSSLDAGVLLPLLRAGSRAPPGCSSSTGPIVGNAFTKPTPTTSEATASATGSSRRCAIASTTRPSARARYAARVCVQSSPRTRPPAAATVHHGAPPGDEVEEHDHEHVRGRERAEERRAEPADRVLLVARVQNPVLRQAREARAVDEPELLLEPAGHARVAPPLERHEVDVDEPPGRDRDRDADERQREAAPGCRA